MAKPNPIEFFRQVRQVEVDGEGAGDLFSAGEGPLAHERHDLRGRSSAGAGRDDGVPQLLDVRQEFVAAVLAQHLTEKFAEQPDIAAQQLGHLEPGTLPALGCWRRAVGFFA